MNSATTPLPSSADVLVVGAGPTGLALATVLARAGVRTVIVDRLAAGLNTSRAAVVHAHTLEVLTPLGVVDDLVRDGLTLKQFSLRDRDSVLARLRFDRLPSPHASLLMLPQERTEHHIEAALRRAGGVVHRGCAVVALRATDGGAEASIETPEGRRVLHARHVVGADGMHSIVRTTAGIGFSGKTYDESFVLADVDMTWGHGRDEVNLFFSPAGLVVVAPLPNDRWRLVATLEDAPHEPTQAQVQALLDARGPTRGRANVTAVHWSTRFRVHHRVADRYRSGPFLLVGDAAHVHSPAGGQGMNTGLVDACVLGELLVHVHRKAAPDQHLAHYERLRRPAALQVLGLSGRLTRMATVRGVAKRCVRNLLLRAVGSLPLARQRLLHQLSGIARRSAAVVPSLAQYSASAVESA